MAKKEVYEGLDPEDLDDEDLELMDKEREKKVARPVPKERVVKKRFAVFSQQSRLGIGDTETGEVVGEGDVAILEVLANILERLERIETNIGSLVGR